MANSVIEQPEDDNFHLSILQDITQIINFADNFQETLDKVVNLVTQRLQMDVCSIFLLDKDTNTIVLQATKGLNQKSVDIVRLKVGEGVTSLAIEEMKPIAINNVQQHPRYIYFPETEENQFNSFLGVPIMENKKPIGVLAVQKREKYSFHKNEINMLQVLAVQVASVLQVAKMLERTVQNKSLMAEPVKAKKGKVLSLQGIPTSFGYGYGKALIFNERYNYSVITDKKVDNIDEEIDRFEKAVSNSKDEIYNIKNSLRKKVSNDILGIFDYHLMILDDLSFHTKIKELIHKGNNAAYATIQVIDYYIFSFESVDDPIIKDKIIDIEDIGRRLINNLLGVCPLDLRNLSEPCVIVARFLTPSTTANLDASKVAGIITEHGGETSHASILARSLEIPAVVGVKNLLGKIGVEDSLIVDGGTGFVFLNPPKSLIKEYQRKAELEIQEYHNFFLKEVSHPLTTADHIPVNVSANIGMRLGVDIAKRNGAKSVGLFRTEFLYMTQNQFPSVEEQYLCYKDVIDAFPDGEVIIRTLDIGGDKLLPYLPVSSEENPNLGYKSTRFLLDHPKILFDQLKAILKASFHGNIKLLFPMISSMGELTQIKDFLDIAKGTLVYNQAQFNDKIEIGMMIEVPAVLFQIEDFIKEVDFFSIGTNDLIQYLLAVDRDNEKVSGIYNPLHPAVLRAIDMVSKTVAKHNKRLTVCGEMAGKVETSFALLALGIRDLSATPSSIPYIHYLVRKLNQKILDEAREVLLSCTEAQEVELYILKKIGELAPKLHQ